MGYICPNCQAPGAPHGGKALADFFCFPDTGNGGTLTGLWSLCFPEVWSLWRVGPSLSIVLSKSPELGTAALSRPLQDGPPPHYSCPAHYRIDRLLITLVPPITGWTASLLPLPRPLQYGLPPHYWPLFLPWFRCCRLLWGRWCGGKDQQLHRLYHN